MDKTFEEYVKEIWENQDLIIECNKKRIKLQEEVTKLAKYKVGQKFYNIINRENLICFRIDFLYRKGHEQLTYVCHVLNKKRLPNGNDLSYRYIYENTLDEYYTLID